MIRRALALAAAVAAAACNGELTDRATRCMIYASGIAALQAARIDHNDAQKARLAAYRGLWDTWCSGPPDLTTPPAAAPAQEGGPQT